MFFWTRSKEAPLALSKLLCESSDLLGSFETLFLVVLVRAVDVVEHEHIHIYIYKSPLEIVPEMFVPPFLFEWVCVWRRCATETALICQWCHTCRRTMTSSKHLPISLTRLRLVRRCGVARTTQRKRTNVCPQCSNWFWYQRSQTSMLRSLRVSLCSGTR